MEVHLDRIPRPAPKEGYLRFVNQGLDIGRFEHYGQGPGFYLRHVEEVVDSQCLLVLNQPQVSAEQGQGITQHPQAFAIPLGPLLQPHRRHCQSSR